MTPPLQTSFSQLKNNTHKSWYRDPCLRRNIAQCIVISLCVYYLGYDQTLLNGLQALPRWNSSFNNPSGASLGLCTASLFFPAIVSAFLGDWIAGNYGRRWSVGTGASLIFVGALVNAFAKNFATFIGARWIIGAGGGITKVAAPALLHEIAHPRIRASAGATYYGFSYLGGLFSAWICFAGLYINSTWSWRFPVIFQLSGPAVILVSLFTGFIPESPRFLIKKGHKQRAHQLLAEHHANGLMEDELVLYELAEIEQALETEDENMQVGYLDFFRTRPNRWRLFVVVVVSVGTNWVGNGVVSYYLSPILKLVGVTRPIEISAINGCLALFNLLVAMIVAQFVDRIGRRPLWLLSTGGMLCAYVLITALSATFAKEGSRAVGLAVIPCLFIFFGFYDIAWTIQSYSYTTEILPYNMRTKGLAIFVSLQNAALAFNSYVNPVALTSIQWKYYFVYIGTISVWFIIIYFTFPEIKNLTIEEVSMVFDRESGRQGFNSEKQHCPSDGTGLRSSSEDSKGGTVTEKRSSVGGGKESSGV